MPKVHPVRPESPLEVPLPSIRQVPQHIEFKLKLSSDLAHAATVLGFDQPAIKANRFVQLDVIRAVPVAIEQKRRIRRVAFQHATSTKGFGLQMLKARQQQLWAKMQTLARDMNIKFELWRSHIKEIDGHFGPGVVSYFTFLKTLFKMNAFISILLLIFVVLPGSFLKEKEGANTIYNATVSQSSCFMEKCDYVNTSTVALVPFCSANYLSYTVNSTAKVNPSTHIEILNFTEDFVTGSGWMEFSAVFQGYYLSSTLDISINILKLDYSYNLPLAYIIVTGVYMMCSLFILAAGSASAIKNNMAKRSKNVKKCSLLTFSSWSFGLTSEYSAKLVHNQIKREAKALLAQDRDTQRRKQFTTAKKCRVYLLRLVVNVFVLVMLSCASYLIAYVTDQSTKLRSTYSGFFKLVVSYTPSLTLAVLNIVLPSLFERISRVEDYTPENMLNMSLIRSVVVRLAGLVVLVVTLYRQVTCADIGYSTHIDECGVHNSFTTDCPQLYCCETYVGQQFYKLALMQLFIFTASTLLIDFPRRLIVTKCSFKLAQKLGQPEFNLSVNVMKLVYLQTVCWFGTFFTPVLPSMVFLLLLIIFYLKKVSLLMNYKRNEETITSSDANRFLVVLLLLSFVLTMVALSYVITKLPPSKGCGPFRIYDVMYDVVHVTMCSWPCRLLQVLSFITSATFLAPLLLAIAVTTTYYLTAVASVNKARYKAVSDQLKTEIENRRELLKALAAARVTQSQTNGDDDRIIPEQVVERNLPVLLERSAPQKGNKKTTSENAVSHKAVENHVTPLTARNVQKNKPSGGPLTEVVVESPSTSHSRDNNTVPKIMVAPGVASVGVAMKSNLLLFQTNNYNHNYNFSTDAVQSAQNSAFFTQNASYINAVDNGSAASASNATAARQMFHRRELGPVQLRSSAEHQYSEVMQLAAKDYYSKINPSNLSKDSTVTGGVCSPQAVTVSDDLTKRTIKASTGSLKTVGAPVSQAVTATVSLLLETSAEVQRDASPFIAAFASSSTPRNLPKLEQEPASRSSGTENAKTSITDSDIASNSLLHEATNVPSDDETADDAQNTENLEETTYEKENVYSDKNKMARESILVEKTADVQNDAATVDTVFSPSLAARNLPQLEQSLGHQSHSAVASEEAAITQVEIPGNHVSREATDVASNGDASDVDLSAQRLEEIECDSPSEKDYSDKNSAASESMSLETSSVAQSEASTVDTEFAPSLAAEHLSQIEQSLAHRSNSAVASEEAAITPVEIPGNSVSREATDVASSGDAAEVDFSVHHLEEIERASPTDNVYSDKNNAASESMSLETSCGIRNDASTVGTQFVPSVMPTNLPQLEQSLATQNSSTVATEKVAKTQVETARSPLSHEAVDVVSDVEAGDVALDTQNLREVEFASEQASIDSYMNNKVISGIVETSVQGNSKLLLKKEYAASDTICEVSENSDAQSLRYSMDTNTHSAARANDAPSQVFMEDDSSLSEMASSLSKNRDHEAPGVEASQATMTSDHQYLLQESTVSAVKATMVTGNKLIQDAEEFSVATLRKVSLTTRSSEELPSSDALSRVPAESYSLFEDFVHTANDNNVSASEPRQAQVPPQSDSLLADPDLAMKSSTVALGVDLPVDANTERHLHSSSQGFTVERCPTDATLVASSHVLAESSISELEDALAIHVGNTAIPISAPNQQTIEKARGSAMNDYKSTDVSRDQLSAERSASAKEVRVESDIAEVGTRPIPVVADSNPLMLDQQNLLLKSNNVSTQLISADVAESDLWWLKDSVAAPNDDASVTDKLSNKSSSESDLSW